MFHSFTLLRFWSLHESLCRVSCHANSATARWRRQASFQLWARLGDADCNYWDREVGYWHFTMLYFFCKVCNYMPSKLRLWTLPLVAWPLLQMLRCAAVLQEQFWENLNIFGSVLNREVFQTYSGKRPKHTAFGLRPCCHRPCSP